jgi:hypothetical protein
MAALVKRAPDGDIKSATTSEPHCPRGRVVKATTTAPPNTKHSAQPVTEAPSQPKVTTARKTAGSKEPKPKSTAATKLVAGKTNKKAWSVNPVAATPSTPELVVPKQSSTSSLEEISDSSFTSLFKHVWKSPVGSSRPTPPYPLRQAARGLP